MTWALGRPAAPGRPTRRQLLAGVAALSVAPSAAGCSLDGAPTPSVATWWQHRGSRFFIAHRGSGDVFPEHSLPAYEGALAWGAPAIEVSVVRTSDGVLFCQHDLDFRRTTTIQGLASQSTWAALADVRIEIPRLGPRWLGDRRPGLARLDTVLTRLGHKTVVVLEAKDPEAFEPMLALVAELGVQSCVVCKLHQSSRRIPRSRAAGLPVFCYFGAPEEVTADRLVEVGATLNREQDLLVIPTGDGDNALPDPLVAAAVATGIPVCVFPVHRRSEVDYFAARGVQGFVTSSYGYVAGAVAPVTATEWEQGAIAPGEMTVRPELAEFGLAWPGLGVVQLAAQDRMAFLTLGQLAPLARPTAYRLDLQVRVDRAPADGGPVEVAFGHPDDRYYESGQGRLDGYHALLGMDGTLQLGRHQAGNRAGMPLAATVPGPALTVGTWVPLRLDVTPDTMTWSRMDTGAAVTGRDATLRGSYLHVGRASTTGLISLRGLRIS